MGNRAQKTEHSGAKKGQGAYYGRKHHAKSDSDKRRRHKESQTLRDDVSAFERDARVGETA